MKPLVIVVALARNGVIGRDNGLPWKMRSDLKHFKAVTLGKPLIMGRRTFESIGKPLPGRETIVVSRQTDYRPDGVHRAASLAEAIELANPCAESMGASEIILAGGAMLYAEALPLADRIVMSRLALDVEGDARFPAIDPNQWRQTSQTHHARDVGDDADFDVVIYERAAGPIRD